jgi:hypothetical protein
MVIYTARLGKLVLLLSYCARSGCARITYNRVADAAYFQCALALFAVVVTATLLLKLLRYSSCLEAPLVSLILIAPYTSTQLLAFNKADLILHCTIAMYCT